MRRPSLGRVWVIVIRIFPVGRKPHAEFKNVLCPIIFRSAFGGSAGCRRSGQSARAKSLKNSRDGKTRRANVQPIRARRRKKSWSASSTSFPPSRPGFSTTTKYLSVRDKERLILLTGWPAGCTDFACTRTRAYSFVSRWPGHPASSRVGRPPPSPSAGHSIPPIDSHRWVTAIGRLDGRSA